MQKQNVEEEKEVLRKRIQAFMTPFGREHKKIAMHVWKEHLYYCKNQQIMCRIDCHLLSLYTVSLKATPLVQKSSATLCTYGKK